MNKSATTPWGSLRPRGLAAVCLAALRKDPPGDIRRFLHRVVGWLGPQYDIEIRGLKLRCHVADNMSETAVVVDSTFHDEQLAKIIGELKPGDTFVDVGANTGIFTNFAARAVGPTGIVLAIEPNQAMVERLRFNAQLNKHTNIRIAAMAVGDAAGSADLYVLANHQHRSSMRAAAVQKRRDPDAKAVRVEVAPLQAILASHGIAKIDAMKVDVEGYEDRAILPFFDAAPKNLWPRRILIEISNGTYWERDCLAHLISLGYQVVWQDQHDALLELPSH